MELRSAGKPANMLPDVHSLPPQTRVRLDALLQGCIRREQSGLDVPLAVEALEELALMFGPVVNRLAPSTCISTSRSSGAPAGTGRAPCRAMTCRRRERSRPQGWHIGRH